MSPISVRFSDYRLLFTRIKKTKKTGNQQKGKALIYPLKRGLKEYFCFSVWLGVKNKTKPLFIGFIAFAFSRCGSAWIGKSSLPVFLP
jgi:hypothetical protein